MPFGMMWIVAEKIEGGPNLPKFQRVAILSHEKNFAMAFQLESHGERSAASFFVFTVRWPAAASVYRALRARPSAEPQARRPAHYNLKRTYTIVVVTHNMQQAARVSDETGFFLNDRLVEFNKTKKVFTTPENRETEDYITGRFG